jgi:hypothetical protein
MTATLQDIRLKIRRITKSPSVNQITDSQIDQYVNTFYLWDFPEHLRLFDLHSNLSITTAPNIDTYDLPTSLPTLVPAANLGSLNAVNVFQINIITFLGLPNDATIIGGSVNITVNTADGSQFIEEFPYTGQLIQVPGVSGDGTVGSINYTTGDLNLNFSSNVTASQVQITFQYTVPEFITINPPLYIAGYQSLYTQSQEEFYRMYPKIRTITALTYGDATIGAGPYSGYFEATPVLRNNVLIDSVDVDGDPLILNDDGLGNLVGNGTGTVNYITGLATFTFSTPVMPGMAINSQTVPYVANRPAAALYFNDQLILRPVPDQSYTVEIEGYRRPTQLIAQGDMPLLREWWQFLAMGASMKIFEDRGDHQSIQLYTQMFNQYRNQAERKTIVQLTNQRSATIYQENQHQAWGNFFGSFF